MDANAIDHEAAGMRKRRFHQPGNWHATRSNQDPAYLQFPFATIGASWPCAEVSRRTDLSLASAPVTNLELPETSQPWRELSQRSRRRPGQSWAQN